jgi:glycopeptide antibiotics resistance protein
MNTTSEIALLFIAAANLIYLIIFSIILFYFIKTSERIKKIAAAFWESISIATWFGYLVKKYFKEWR